MDFLPSHYDKHKKIWSSPKITPIYHPDCSMGKIIFNQLKNWPKNVMQISDVDGKKVTNEEVLTWSIRIAQSLKKLSLRHDDVVGIAASNTTYVAAVANGCLFNATPFHAINPIQDEEMITHLYGLTKPKVIFCDGSVYDKMYKATQFINPLIYTLSNHIDNVPSVEDLLKPSGTEKYYIPEPTILGDDQTMIILCSSGTTGLPKAVCLPNSYLKFEMSLLNSEEIIYNSSTIDWLTGVYTYLISVTMGCTRIITNKPFSPEYYVELIKKYKVTWSMVAPRHLAALTSCPSATPINLASVRVLSCGGGSISLSTLQRTQAIFPNAVINFGYALTETGPISTNLGLDNGTSVGKLVPGVCARIVDDNGKNLGPNEVGEIYFKNGHTWSGYYGSPIATQRMIDNLGWFHTGDLGYFDENNFLYVVDRKKDTCKYQGMHYWPSEIEEVIAKMPAVADVCVFGIYDEKNGDAASALVVRSNGCKLSEEDVKQQVAKHFPAQFKHLHGGVMFADKLPQNPNGKTDKKSAKSLFIDMRSKKSTVER